MNGFPFLFPLSPQANRRTLALRPQYDYGSSRCRPGRCCLFTPRRSLLLSGQILVLFYFSFFLHRNVKFDKSKNNDHIVQNIVISSSRKDFGVSLEGPVLNGSNNQTRRILLVHVGKTGGETLKHVLRVGCLVRSNPLQKERCWRKFTAKYNNSPLSNNDTANQGKQDTHSKNSQEPLLSKQVTGYFHYRRMTPASAIDNATHFLYTVRHPLARIQSWFRYISPLNCIVEKETSAGKAEPNQLNPAGSSDIRGRKRPIDGKPLNCRVREAFKKNPQSAEARFFSCFPTLEHMANYIVYLNRNQSSGNKMRNYHSRHCVTMLREIIESNNLRYWGPSELLMGHFVMNYHYYTRKTIEQKSDASVFAIRTESLWDDIISLDQFLGGSGQFKNQGLRATHNSERFVDRAMISMESARRFCCVLENELLLYRKIIERAANLNATEKTRTLKQATDYCNVKSWYELAEQCRPFDKIVG